MKIRIHQTYNKDGANSDEILQYWDEEAHCWDDVPYIRESEEEAEENKQKLGGYYAEG